MVSVSGDRHCEFHTAAMLLGYTDDDKTRKTLARKTAQCLMDNKHLKQIEVYMNLNKVYSLDEIKCLFMKEKRWLSVHEVAFILLAHGKLPALITENSYPVYDASCLHYIIKDNHFEPLIPLQS